MNPQHTYTDKALFEQIAADDENAFRILFHRWKNRIYGIAHRFTEHSFRSEEIVQDVFLHLWKNRAQLAAIEQPEAWIYSITRNRSMTAFKLLVRDPAFHADSLEYLPHTETAADPLDLQDLKGLLEQALLRLSPQQRRVFELSRLMGLDREAIARELGIAKATVSVHLTIALRTVRAYLLTKLDLVTVLLLLGEYF